uniref:Uncharacterized protein n=1 Tax=Rhizophora mucronata TaxID=61149 RepID=A0A2P2N7V6_RHIMU
MLVSNVGIKEGGEEIPQNYFFPIKAFSAYLIFRVLDSILMHAHILIK